MSEVLVFLAEGFEEIEALTVVDLMRRAGIDTAMTAIGESLSVTGARGIEVKADILLKEADFDAASLLVLPGGMPGTLHLGESEMLLDKVKAFGREKKRIAAICAAPSILGDLGLLKGEKAVCYPGFEERLTSAEVLKEEVVTSGHITTSRGLGTAIPFALELITLLRDKETADKIKTSVIYRAEE